MAARTPLVLVNGRVQQLQAGDTLAGVTAEGALPLNLLINGEPIFAQRVNPTSSTAVLNDSYDHFDRWYSLRQGAGGTITRSTGSDGTRYAMKLTAGGTTNRFGVAQIVESFASVPMRGRTVRFQCRVRPNRNAGSGTIDVRCAILEWTGTADSVTSELVDTWTSSNYTVGAGNFFAGQSKTLIGTAQISANHGTWTDLSVTGTVSSSCNNLIVFVWWEDVPSHASDYLELCKMGLYDGQTAQSWLPRPVGQELALCQRYYEKSYALDVPPGTTGGSTMAGILFFTAGRNSKEGWASYWWNTAKRTIPTITFHSPQTGAAGKAYNYDAAGDTSVYVNNASETCFTLVTAPQTTQHTLMGVEVVADAEL